MAPATSLPLESGNNILFPPMYDLVWSVIPFVILLVVAITVATVEYTRKRDVVASLGWGALVLFLPIIEFVIWAVAALIRRENRTAIKG